VDFHLPAGGQWKPLAEWFGLEQLRMLFVSGGELQVF
jgi:hypothetical protein